MFTVVISSKRVREDCQKRFSRFLEPLIDPEKFAFCDWNINGNSPETAVPELKFIAAEHKEWRAVIVEDGFNTDEGKILSDELRKKRNPFEYVRCFKSPYEIETVEQAAQFRLEKYAAYEKAIENPLVKLTTWLCDGCVKNDPDIDEEILEVSKECGEEYAEWLRGEDRPDISDIEADLCRKKKFDLLSTFWNPEEIHFFQPQQVICISPRTFDDDELVAKLAWECKNEFEYSTFYEENLYSNKLRYLVFDVPDHSHQNFEAEYVKFLSFLLVFSKYEYPTDVLKPNRVYSVNCENDEDALSEFLSLYDYKLRLTQSCIQNRIVELNNRQPQILTNDEIEELYLTDSEVPVEMDSDFDMNTLHAEYKDIGLSEDCPVDEMGYWVNQYCSMIKNFKFFLKQPRRALKRSADFVRNHDTANLERADSINSFQEEDIEEKLYEDERKMIESRIDSVCNTKPYFKQFSDGDRKIRRIIRTRMSKKTTIALSLTVLLVYFIGFIPLLIGNFIEDGELETTLTMTFGSIGVLALVAFVCLFFLRSKLVKEIRNFNLMMDKIIGTVIMGMHRAAQYLGKICDVLRINSVLSYLHQDHDEASVLSSIYKNHVAQIEKERQECGYIFNKFITKKIIPGGTSIEPYEFDFTQDVEYEYRIPDNIWNEKKIDFMQRDNLITIPVNFIKSISVEREELYDV